MAAPKWIEFDPTFGLSDMLQSVTDALGPMTDVFSQILDALASAADIAGAFAQSIVDIQQAMIDALIAVIDELIQALTQTGIYRLFYMPQSYFGTLTMEQWVQGVCYSLDDYADDLRPILVDKSGYVSAVAVVVVASTYKELLSNFRHAFDNMRKKIADAIQIDRWPERDDPWKVVSGIGVEPNWGSIRLYDVIPPVSDLVGYLLKLRSLVESGPGASGVYSSFADLLRAKAEQLAALLDYLNKILSSIENSLNYEGSYVLPIYGQGDKEWLKSILLNSRGGPWEVEDGRFTAGAVFLATGGTSAGALFDLFGLPQRVAEVPGEWTS